MANTFKSVYTDGIGFSYIISTSVGRLIDTGYKSAEEAAWACDQSRFALSHILRRKRGYNFPERIRLMTTGEQENPPRAVIEFMTLHNITPQIELGPSGLTDEMRSRGATAQRLEDEAAQLKRDEAKQALRDEVAKWLHIAQTMRADLESKCKLPRGRSAIRAASSLVAALLLNLDDLR